ncbi:DNA-binding transcriptional MerR regulator [Nonomuraea fuscirosea]|uniref:DNA-binding transcriptional MerR regulator n=1 Tax=Nonomuraea fuscirosea TaxID=1291556 RepID=A0A2T0MYQ3_9ACTN|nr:MerR family transcriptional regulator [Nonomuraea fuscirosea]PRX64339.1 DNA-binding transcriptional MerR regulator [Nonomuraea fuscirosea]
MKIGDLARETGVSRRLLRYYEEQGLLRPRRLPNGYREYTEADVAGVRHIRAMLAAGLPTAVIARLLDCVHDDDGERMVPTGCPGMVTDLRHEQQRIAAEIDRLRTSQQALDTMLTSALRQRDPHSTPASNRS